MVREQQLKCLTESGELTSARFDECEADHKKKDGMINSLEDKVLGLTEKVGKLSSLVVTDRKNIFFLSRARIKKKS